MPVPRSALLGGCLLICSPAIAQETPDPKDSDELVVEADPLNAPYQVNEPVSAGKAVVPILESERRVDAVPKALMRDTAATTVEELYRFIPNLVLTESGSANLRGFGSGRGAMLIDNLGNSPYQVLTPFLVNVERVEVMKGPSGVLHGSGHAGGNINLILETPQAEFAHSFVAYFDSLGQRRVEVDTTGPVIDDTLLYRVNLALEDSETFRANGKINNAFGSLGITWKPTQAFETTFQGMAAEDVRTGGRGYGYPIFDGKLDFFDRSMSINEASDQRRNAFLWATLTSTLHLGSDWDLQLAAFANDFDYSNRYHEGRRSAADVGARIMNRQWRDQFVKSAMIGYDLRFMGGFDLGSTHHDVFIGHDVRAFTNPLFPAIRARIANPRSPDQPQGAAPIDLLAPVYTGAAEESYTLTGDNETTADRLNLGAYATWRGTFFDDLHTMAGARFDTYEEQTYSTDFLTDEQTDTDDDSQSISWQAGLVYALMSDAVSVYATYSGGYREQSWFAQGNPNGPFDPFVFNQLEVGAQAEVLDKKLIATLAVFRIDSENELTPDPDPNAPTGARVAEGVTRSQGVEATLVGRPFPRWDITAQFGLTDAYTLESNLDNEGDPLAQVAQFTGGAWIGHRLGRLPLRLFGGMSFVGDRPTHSDDTNPLASTMPAYAIFDVGGRFTQGGWSAQLNFNNLLDQTYFTHYRGPAHSVTPGAPRSMRLSISAHF